MLNCISSIPVIERICDNRELHSLAFMKASQLLNIESLRVFIYVAPFNGSEKIGSKGFSSNSELDIILPKR